MSGSYRVFLALLGSSDSLLVGVRTVPIRNALQAISLKLSWRFAKRLLRALAVPSGKRRYGVPRVEPRRMQGENPDELGKTRLVKSNT
jgi:hypothetical protein